MKFVEIYILALTILAADAAQNFGFYSNNEAMQDARLYMTDLVRKHGYDIEEHKVTTKDGYILTIFRLPPTHNCGNQTIKKPILLTHGLFSSSYDYVAEGPKQSFGYLLSNECYDVWLKNSRGNSVSRSHVSLSSRDPEFWNFSWHEMGKYDLPAVIDYILNATNETSLHYIGHSQGTTEFFVFGSLHPEYHKKIVSMHALSPIVYLDHVKNPAFNLGVLFYKPLKFLSFLLGVYNFYPIVLLANIIGPTLLTSLELQPLLTNLYFIFLGFDEPEFNITAAALHLPHAPSDSSTKQLFHYAQVIKSHKFRHFDYGIYKNLEVYNSIFPPEYNISSINVPIVVYYALNDNVLHVKDAKKTIKNLPNVVDVYEIPFSKFNHLDYIIATDAKILLYDKILESLKRFE